MPENAVIGQFERRLVELGCPAVRARGKARELSDHWADLKQAGLEDGLSESEAEGRAAAQLGEPTRLAEYLIWTMRQSSWWGRHPILGFCILPLFGFIPVWVVCGWLLIAVVWLAGHLVGPDYLVTRETAHALALDPTEFTHYAQPLNLILNAAASALMAGLFCLLARRSASGLKWIAAACAVCSLGCAFSRTEIVPGSIAVAWVSKPNWSCATIPWLVAALAFGRYWLVVRRLPACAVPGYSGGAGAQAGPTFPADGSLTLSGKLLTTPTYWISTPVLLGLLVLGSVIVQRLAKGHAELLQRPARLEMLRKQTWPAESAAVMAQLKSREMVVNTNQRTVDLLPWVNMQLTESDAELGDPAEFALLDLPLGTHVFGSTLFDVSGKIQLMGRSLLKENRLYPVQRKGITVQQKCRRLHLLHGASHAVELETTAARLVLHYADGSVREIGIVMGEQLLNSWGPLYTTPLADERVAPKAPETMLAWAAQPAGAGDETPWMAARVYQSTFANPAPEVEIASVDYVSTLSEAAPFLLGLTIEK
jgi:hypothetical protein